MRRNTYQTFTSLPPGGLQTLTKRPKHLPQTLTFWPKHLPNIYQNVLRRTLPRLLGILNHTRDPYLGTVASSSHDERSDASRSPGYTRPIRGASEGGHTRLRCSATLHDRPIGTAQRDSEPEFRRLGA